MSSCSDLSDSDTHIEELRRPFAPDMEKVRRKMRHIPTLEGLLAEKNPNEYTAEQLSTAKVLAQDLLERNPRSEKEMKLALVTQRKQFKTDNKKSLLLAGYKAILLDSPTSRNPFLESWLITKAPRSQSGVLVVTVFTSSNPDGQKFSCKWNCYYCPNEPGQPRSYLLNEPGVRRANRLGFDPVLQFRDRVKALEDIGHPADKVELLVLGGTWESYPEGYRERFIRDLFYAANTYFDDESTRRPPLDLLQEQLMNEIAKCKIIGVTLETRPDTVNPKTVRTLRKYGCTRVQLGVQHTNDGILLLINREQTREDVSRAIRLLKDACFKVDIHLMPDLPGTTPQLDKDMFDDVLYSPELQADQWKIYPCQTTPFTLIKQWYEEGKYESYGIDELMEVILYVKRKVHPWIRLNRVIRDIPIEYVLAGCERANLRQLLGIKLEKEGRYCPCIRCREVKGDKETNEKLRTAVLKERAYDASGGKEIFLSYETPDERTIFGFLRLRFAGIKRADEEEPFPELGMCGLIRELHVYGNLISTYDASGVEQKAQHTGIGTKLLQRAEEITRSKGMFKIAVISGIGVRTYYHKRGYRVVNRHEGGFMIKELSPSSGAMELISSVAASTSAPLQWDAFSVINAIFNPATTVDFKTETDKISDRLRGADEVLSLRGVARLAISPWVILVLVLVAMSFFARSVYQTTA